MERGQGERTGAARLEWRLSQLEEQAWAPCLGRGGLSGLRVPARDWKSPAVHHRLSELAGACDIIKTDPTTPFRLILYATDRTLGT